MCFVKLAERYQLIESDSELGSKEMKAATFKFKAPSPVDIF